MSKKLLKCPVCFNYTINYVGKSKLCEKCGNTLIYPHPPRFSMEANPKYLSYIRKLKKMSQNNF